MENICEYIISFVDYKLDELIDYQNYNSNEFDNLNECIDIISYKLDIKKEEIILKDVNFFLMRATIISFVFKDRYCEIYEYFGKDKDYIGVRLMPL